MTEDMYYEFPCEYCGVATWERAGSMIAHQECYDAAGGACPERLETKAMESTFSDISLGFQAKGKMKMSRSQRR